MGTKLLAGDAMATNLFISELDEEKNFTDKIVRLTFRPELPEQTAKEIRQLVATVEQEESGANALRKRVLALGDLTADAGLVAGIEGYSAVGIASEFIILPNPPIQSPPEDEQLLPGFFTVFEVSEA